MCGLEAGRAGVGGQLSDNIPVMATTEQAAAKVDADGVQGGANEASAQIRQLVEFYFGDSNFRRDTFMKAEAGKNSEGWYMGFL
jgi:hypothetical protein